MEEAEPGERCPEPTGSGEKILTIPTSLMDWSPSLVRPSGQGVPSSVDNMVKLANCVEERLECSSRGSSRHQGTRDLPYVGQASLSLATATST